MPPPSIGSSRRRRGDVVGHEDGPHLDPRRRCELGGEVEVHDVAAIVAVDVQDAAPPGHRLGHLEHLVGARRCEDLTDRRAGKEARADIAEEDRQVAGPAPADDRHLPLVRRRRPNDSARPDTPKLVRVGGEDALEHLVDEPLGVIQDLLHPGLPVVNGATSATRARDGDGDRDGSGRLKRRMPLAPPATGP
jgi:hypothetical protein